MGLIILIISNLVLLDSLRIGDYITLKAQKYDSFMLADGILVDNPNVAETNNIESFEDSLFCIHFQRQYSADRELEEFNEANMIIESSVTQGDTNSKYLRALRVSEKTIRYKTRN